MIRIDLNCDMGEGIGADDELFPWITSANIACGFHAGSPEIMRASVRAAIRHQVGIGAHPGLPDRENFGRVARGLTEAEARTMVVDQVAALEEIARAEGGALVHVKPHGALYNMASDDIALADAIAHAVRAVDPRLILMGLSGSELIRAGERAGLATASEVFADRGYLPDGSLVPRGRPDALITDVNAAVRQSIRLVRDQRVSDVGGGEVTVRAESICLHGDGAHAVEFARAIRTGLEAEGIAVVPLRDQSGRARA